MASCSAIYATVGSNGDIDLDRSHGAPEIAHICFDQSDHDIGDGTGSLFRGRRQILEMLIAILVLTAVGVETIVFKAFRSAIDADCGSGRRYLRILFIMRRLATMKKSMAMAKIEFDDGGVEVDAAIIAKGPQI